jgi:hypothetical protein
MVAASLHQEFSDWHATVSFYAAVHYLEALFDDLELYLSADNGIKKRVRHSDEGKKFVNACVDAEIDKLRKAGDPRFWRKSWSRISSDHRARRRIILDNDKTRDFFKPYGNLEEVCKKARYHCFAPETYKPTSIREWLTTIEALFTKVSRQKVIPPKPKDGKWAEQRSN